MDISKFDWGTSIEWFKNTINIEIFQNRCYEKLFEVENDDIVVDIGASIGPFTYSILPKKPKKVFCLEPSFEEFQTLIKNTISGPVYCINKGISNSNGEHYFPQMYDNVNLDRIWYSITFMKLIQDLNINKIDFLKTDCEGGEYDIFNIENLFWIKNNIKKITGEWHLETQEEKEKFKVFRDVYLRVLPNHKVFSIDGYDITWDLWNEHFIEYYTQVIIYIDNR